MRSLPTHTATALFRRFRFRPRLSGRKLTEASRQAPPRDVRDARDGAREDDRSRNSIASLAGGSRSEEREKKKRKREKEAQAAAPPRPAPIPSSERDQTTRVAIALGGSGRPRDKARQTREAASSSSDTLRHDFAMTSFLASVTSPV